MNVSGTMRDTTDRSDLMDVSGILLSICICLAPSNGILRIVAVALRLSATTLRIAYLTGIHWAVAVAPGSCTAHLTNIHWAIAVAVTGPSFCAAEHSTDVC